MRKNLLLFLFGGDSLEVWKSVKGYEGLYEVSNKGNVRSVDRYVKGNSKQEPYFVKGKAKSINAKNNGYLVVNLCKNNICRSKHVHRLVAEAFIKNTFNKRTVNHKDFDKTNNCVENLEWASYKENNKHARDNKPNANWGGKDLTYIRLKLDF